MIQPASKGPFEAHKCTLFANGEDVGDIIGLCTSKEQDMANAIYFAHAANQLPECIKAMERAHWAMGATLGAIVGVMSDDVCESIRSEASALKAAIEAAIGTP